MCIMCVEFQAKRMTLREVVRACSELPYEDREHIADMVHEYLNNEIDDVVVLGED